MPLQIEMVAVPPPYHAAEVRAHFPVTTDAPKLRSFLVAVAQAAAGSGLGLDVFFQNEYLANGREIVNSHMPEWHPQVGLGVWPDRPAPELWKVSDLFRMARGEKIPLMFQVSRITAGARVQSDALDLLLGSGMTIGLMHAGSINDLLDHYKAAFLPAIKEPSLRIQPFYVPLLDLNSLKSSHLDLPNWLGGARLYMRESPGDNSVLMISDLDLKAFLTRAGAQTQDDGQHWTVR